MSEIVRNRAAIESAIKAINAAFEMPHDESRDYLEMICCASVHYMRALYGDEYARAFLTSALSDLDRPPLVGISEGSKQ